MSLSDIFALIAILAALVGFTGIAPRDVTTPAQAVYYIFTAVFIITLVQRFRHRKKGA